MIPVWLPLLSCKVQALIVCPAKEVCVETDDVMNCLVMQPAELPAKFFVTTFQ